MVSVVVSVITLKSLLPAEPDSVIYDYESNGGVGELVYVTDKSLSKILSSTIAQWSLRIFLIPSLISSRFKYWLLFVMAELMN